MDPMDLRLEAIEYLINRCEDRAGPGKLAETIDALRMLGVDDDELAEVGVLDIPQSVPVDAVIR